MKTLGKLAVYVFLAVALVANAVYSSINANKYSGSPPTNNLFVMTNAQAFLAWLALLAVLCFLFLLNRER